jgi:hypothetical protein
VSRESSIAQTNLKGSERREAAARRWQWIFAVLIIAGLILILLSVAMLLRDAVPALAADACAWIARP